mgnify:CR=1 FL=1
MSDDLFWMRLAHSLAESAGRKSEVPVGAVIVKDGRLIGSGINLREQTFQATAHAELLAINQASLWLKAWRLTGCTLYVTLEPCLMCAGALYQARVDRVVYAAADPKAGSLGSLYSLHQDSRLNHRYSVESGLMEDEAGQLLKAFFRKRRAQNLVRAADSKT